MASTGTLTATLATPQLTSAGQLKVKGQLVHYGLNVAFPIITPASGDYPTEVVVTVTDATPDATIHYRTDGVTPTELDPLYSGPVTLVL